MALATWIVPVLWREHDWRTALARLGAQLVAKDDGVQTQRAALDLGAALEYIDPDRRRAIEIYEVAGVAGVARARALAVELGWWAARARSVHAARLAKPDDATLVVAEAEAWWDAGQRALCGLALAGVRGADLGPRALDLAALVARKELAAHLSAAIGRARGQTGEAGAEACVMVARLARETGRADEALKWLEAALAASPGHAVASRSMLDLALDRRDGERLQRVLRAQMQGASEAAAVEAMRASAFALIDSDHHRGFGLRLVRQTLERAYAAKLAAIPGHVAMWTVLAAHALADGTRRDLLPFVIEALQTSHGAVDRVWLGALATEISLREAKHVVVAGAYAEIVAEHAPAHPIVRELVALVAADEDADEVAAFAIPVEAKTAAVSQMASEDVDIDVDLDGVYADAVEAAETAPAPAPVSYPTMEIERLSDFAVSPPMPPPGAPAPAPVPASKPEPEPEPEPVPVPVAPAKLEKPRVATKQTAIPTIASVPRPSVAPASVAKPAIKPSSIVPASLTERRPIAPAPVPKPRPVVAASSGASLSSPSLAPPPSLAKKTPAPAPAKVPSPSQLVARIPAQRAQTDRTPVLAALRTQDRPAMPPRAPDPVDAKQRARRIAIPIDVRFVLGDGSRVDGHSRDISTTGMFVLVDVELAIGAELAIELLVPGEEAFSETEHTARARIVRRDANGYGVELIAPAATLVAALAKL